jgi:hypothetical protein
MTYFRLVRRTIATSSLLPFLLGCSGALSPQAATPQAITVSGNWQISSPAVSSNRLGGISGELTGSSANMTGIFHTMSAGACIAPSDSFAISGSADANRKVTLSSLSFHGGTLVINGTLSADGSSFSSATVNVIGGSCAFTATAAAVAQSYSSISGAYAGTFADPNGQVISITANLTQTPASDTSGNFQLSGNATFPNNPCFSSPVSISASQVSGGSFDLTYADTITGNSVEALGTFSTDGKTLNVTQWTLSGPCGSDTGTGLISRP